MKKWKKWEDMSADEKEQAITERKAKVEETEARLDAGLTEMVSSGRWMEYLSFASRFHRYSFLNQLLIWFSAPNATRVASFKTWKSLGRHVKAGEKGIIILVPIIAKKKAKRSSTDDGAIEIGIVEDDETIRPMDDVEVKTLVGFTTGHVFDISQTEGKELPDEPAYLLGEDKDGLYQALRSFSQEMLNLTITEMTQAELSLISSGAKGVCGFDKVSEAPIFIGVLDSLDGLQKAAVAAHELSHALMHSAAEYRTHATSSIKELEAESAAFTIMSYFGTAYEVGGAGEFTFSYLLGWAGGKDAIIEIRASGDRIKQAAHRVITWIEEKYTAPEDWIPVELPVIEEPVCLAV